MENENPYRHLSDRQLRRKYLKMVARVDKLQRDYHSSLARIVLEQEIPPVARELDRRRDRTV